MWLYILSFFSREQSHSNKCKQRGPRVASYFPPVPLLSTGFHKHILLPLWILLPLPVSLFFLCLSLKAHCQDMVISSTMPVQAASICSNGPGFLVMRTLTGPSGKHTVSPGSVFEGLPRSWMLTNRLKCILCVGGALRELSHLNVLNVRQQQKEKGDLEKREEV